MYQVIARKYRPQTFRDVVNQEHVKTTLENAIAQNRIVADNAQFGHNSDRARRIDLR